MDGENIKKNGEWKLLKPKTNNHAVSQVISVLLIISMVVTMMAVILLWAMPLIEEKRSENEMQTVFYSFEIMDNTVEGLLMEGSDAKRVVGVVCPNDQGLLSVDSSTDNKLIVIDNSKADGEFILESDQSEIKYYLNELPEWTQEINRKLQIKYITQK